MTPWMVRRAKTAWLLGFAVVLAGFFAVLLFVVQAFLPAGFLPELPRMPAIWVDGSLVRMPLHKVVQIPHQLYAGLAVAVFGLLTMLYGARIARRQIPVLEAAKQRTEDRLRRVQQYAGEERIEPYIGDTITIDVDSEPK
ncbi:MAG: hypothetical protein E6H54_11885 [Betaproteobacteria bacterium]|nr:MAG: hypothetical protein E6H54_11885 [Betaproteobacteria bacterium]